MDHMNFPDLLQTVGLGIYHEGDTRDFSNPAGIKPYDMICPALWAKGENNFRKAECLARQTGDGGCVVTSCATGLALSGKKAAPPNKYVWKAKPKVVPKFPDDPCPCGAPSLSWHLLGLRKLKSAYCEPCATRIAREKKNERNREFRATKRADKRVDKLEALKRDQKAIARQIARLKMKK
jgi:hypothetical protein